MIVRRAGDVIPEIVGPVLAKRKKGARKWKFPTTCPSCGTELVRPPGEADHRCPNPNCPSRNVEWLYSFGSRGGAGHRGARLHDGDGAARPRDREGPRRHLHAHGRGHRPARGVRRQVDHEPAGARSSARRTGRSGGCSRRSTSATSARTSRRCSRTRSSRSTRSLDASAQDIDDVEEIGPEIARSVHDWFADRGNRRLIEKLRAAGVRMRDEVTQAQGQAAARRHEHRPDRWTGEHVPRGGDRRRRRPPAPGSPRASRRRPISSWSGPTPAPRPRRPSSSASRSIDEKEFRKRLGRK